MIKHRTKDIVTTLKKKEFNTSTKAFDLGAFDSANRVFECSEVVDFWPKEVLAFVHKNHVLAQICSRSSSLDFLLQFVSKASNMLPRSGF